MNLFGRKRDKAGLAHKEPVGGACVDTTAGLEAGSGSRGNAFLQEQLKGMGAGAGAGGGGSSAGGVDCAQEVPKPEANGCGPANIPGGGAVGNWMFPLFTEACNTHDVGDGVNPGYATPGADKDEVDQQFLQDMLDTCDATYDAEGLGPIMSIIAGDEKRRCQADALKAYGLVSNLGDSAYEEAQQKGADYAAYAEACLE